ncbi:MAG: hypothetical protein RL119_80 [Actinomycetota bacterium]
MEGARPHRRLADHWGGAVLRQYRGRGGEHGARGSQHQELCLLPRGGVHAAGDGAAGRADQDARTGGGDDRSQQLSLETDGLLDVALGGLKTSSEHRLIHLRCAIGIVGETLFSSSRLNHHDGHIAVIQFATSND